MKEPKRVDVIVGQRIRQRRIEIGMTQETLANALGVTFQQVQKYEKGKNRVSASRLDEISEVLRVPIPYLFNGSGDHGEFEDHFAAALTRRDVQRLLDAYLAMPPGAQKSLVHMLSVFSHINDE